VWEVSPWVIEQAPCITFAQERTLAMKQGLTLRDLVAQFQEDVERPREVFTRVWDTRLGKVVMPYWAVIQWYQKATAPVLALEGELTCASGCLVRVWGRRKWARPGCRMRIYRQSRTDGKGGGKATFNLYCTIHSAVT
jgi:uncharacterized YccA/Bax inhibitor family protein